MPAAIGIVTGIALSAAMPAWIACVAAIMCFVGCMLMGKHYPAYTALFAVIGSALWQLDRSPVIDDACLGHVSDITARVGSVEQRDYGYAVEVTTIKIDGKTVSQAKCMMQVRDFMPESPQPGSLVSFAGRITAIPDVPDVPGDAYHPSWLLRSGIRYQILYKQSTWHILEPASGITALADWLYGHMFRAVVNSPIDGSTASFLLAAMLGNDYFLCDDTMSMYRASGTAHVLALSGMHVATLSMIAVLLLAPLRLMRRGHIYGSVVLIALVWLYALVTGMAPSVMRAATMVSVALIASMMQRGSSPLNSLCIAAVVILAFSPRALFSPGFQMSFCAVLSILVFNQAIPAVLHRKRISYFIANMMFLPLAAMLGTGLLGAYYFHLFPWSFVLGNLVMSLAFPVILGGGFALMLITMAGLRCAWLGLLLDWTLSAVDHVIEWLAEHLDAISVPDFSAWAFVPYAVAFAFLALAAYRHRHEQPCRASATVASCAMALTFATAGCVRQQAPGQAAYLISGSHPLMLVCQPYSVAALPLDATDDFDFNQVQRRFGATARMYRCDSVSRMLGDTSLDRCSLTSLQIMLGATTLRVFDDKPIIRSPQHVHYAVITKEYPYDIATIASACNPDTIVLTGDIVASRRKKLNKQCDDTIPCVDLHLRTIKIPF